MIFESLYESAQRGELILVDGGMAHVHLRRDGVLTLREIIVTRPGVGIGSEILNRLLTWPGAHAIVARCPADLPANKWYERRGFFRVGTQVTRTGRQVVTWQRNLS